MAELAANIVLIVAVFIALTGWALMTTRRSRANRWRCAEERTLILQAFAAVARQHTSAAEPSTEMALAVTAQDSASTISDPGIGAASLAALLDLLENERPRRRGLIAGLVTSPRTVWTAAHSTGQRVRTHATATQPNAGTTGKPAS